MNVNIQKHITLENAKAWEATSEKIIFLCDVFDISASQENLINSIEDQFEILLKGE